MALRDMVIECHDVECDAPDDAFLSRFVPQEQAVLFSSLEEQVMALSTHDTLASLERPGIVERAARLVFGLRTASRALADAKLEALRRAMVVARHRRHLPDALARELRDRGFGAAQLRAIEARAIA